jgi:hypothetical protein
MMRPTHRSLKFGELARFEARPLTHSYFMADGEHNTTVWGIVVTVLAALAIGLSAIEAATHPSDFDWTSGIMIAAYTIFVAVVVLLVGLLRRWQWLVGAPSSTEVTNSHAIRLRRSAEGWSDHLKKSLHPDWAIPLPGFDLLDYSGLEALRAHFPGLDTVYQKYQSLNNQLINLPAANMTMDGKQGRKPTTAEGVAALQERNTAARLVINELDKIQGVKRITIGCAECEGGGNNRPAIVGKEM